MNDGLLDAFFEDTTDIGVDLVASVNVSQS